MQLKRQGYIKDTIYTNTYEKYDDYILLIINRNDEEYNVLIDIDDYDKIKSIHDYIINTTKYDVNNNKELEENNIKYKHLVYTRKNNKNN